MKTWQRQAAFTKSSQAQIHQSSQAASLPAVHARFETGLVRHVIQPKQGGGNLTGQLKRGVATYNEQCQAKVAGLVGQKAVQLKQPISAGNPGKSGSPTAGGVIQLAKWQWSEAKNKWKLLSGSAAEGAPPYDGEYDGEIEEDEEKDDTKNDRTIRGKRVVGDSSALARNRYGLKKKSHDFKKWKKHREAQHIIPATIAKTIPILASIIDDAENGIMLPAEYKSSNTKVTHRKPKRYDHPTYTKNVRGLIKQVLKHTGLKNNQSTMFRLMKALRPVNKLTAYKYIDDIPDTEFTQSWNALNPAHQLP